VGGRGADAGAGAVGRAHAEGLGGRGGAGPGHVELPAHRVVVRRRSLVAEAHLHRVRHACGQGAAGRKADADPAIQRAAAEAGHVHARARSVDLDVVCAHGRQASANGPVKELAADAGRCRQDDFAMVRAELLGKGALGILAGVDAEVEVHAALTAACDAERHAQLLQVNGLGLERVASVALGQAHKIVAQAESARDVVTRAPELALAVGQIGQAERLAVHAGLARNRVAQAGREVLHCAGG